MNVPSMKVMDILGAQVNLGLFEAVGALGTPGVHITNTELNQTPAANCWGGYNFC